MAEGIELTGSCERCRKQDGRATNAYEIKGRTAEFCDECAEANAAAHGDDFKPASATRKRPASDRAADADAGKSAPEKGEAQVPAKG